MNEIKFNVGDGVVRVSEPVFSQWRDGRVRLATFTPSGLFGWGIEKEFEPSLVWSDATAEEFAEFARVLIR